MRGVKSKTGQMKLSFGMIFSIILIIVFLVFAFYAVKKFLAMQSTIQIEKFAEDLQSDIDRAWKSTQSNKTEEYILPKKIDSVCFRDNEYENLIFRPPRIAEGKMIEHLDIGKITKEENPFCIDNSKGKIRIKLKKDYGEILVTIVRP